MKKAKDYAFVHFSSREAAERALSASKGLVIDEADVRLYKLKCFAQFFFCNYNILLFFGVGWGGAPCFGRRTISFLVKFESSVLCILVA